METTENNKLIAEFMGYVLNDNTGVTVYYNDKTCEVLDPDKLKFHSDWNWLMAVIEKIEEKCAFVLIGRMFCEITYTNPLNTNVHFEKKLVSGVRINAVYATCVEFIQWYNQQNQ